MSESPIRLRNRRTPTKGNNNSSILTYKDKNTTPVGKKGEDEESKASSRQTRKSTRNLQLIGGKDFGDDCDSRSSTNSNIENEEKGVREKNENTPQQTGSKLSRKRSTRLTSASSFSVVSSINEDDKSIKMNFRRQTQEAESTPKTSERPKRRSALRSLGVYRMDESDSDSDSDQKRSTRKRNASYFSKQDMDDFRPELEEDEDEVVTSSGEQDDEESSEDEDSENEEEDADPATPNKRPLLQHDLTRLTLTPELLNRIEGRSIRKRIGVNSPVATGSQTMSPNPETYFLAETRLKYKSIVKQSEAMMNDAMKGRRGRKKKMMDRMMESRLPEKIPSDFSVTAEAIKASVNPTDYVEGNSHEERVEELFRSIVDNEFPHWLGLFRDGFNVMLYGYGSKLPILRKFEDMVNNHFLTVSINGLFPKLNARKLLYGICEYVNPDAAIPHGANLEASAKEAVNVLKSVNHSDVFILINNFDNLALRFPQILTMLCWLTHVPYIHILASCDTVNAFLGVTQSQALQLNFCWMHCPTYKPYREEFKWIPGIYGDETKIVTQKSSLKYVLQSLTGNARKAFALLAQMQLKQMKSRAVQKAKEAYAGVRFQELAKECREKFIAHSDENLRTLLVEFFDHKLIRQTGKGKHLENTLLIELDVETLEEIMSDLV